MNRFWYFPALFLVAAFSAALFLVSIPFSPGQDDPVEEEDKRAEIEEVLKDNFIRTMDPELGYPPTEELLQALEETKRLQRRYLSQAVRNNLAEARFRERGPNNIGGRTRVIHVDENDPSRKRVFAGGVSGGLWYCNDVTAAEPVWEKVNDYLDNLFIGALAQDPNDPQVMYLGTGEEYTGFSGLALFKSTDGGMTWNLLPSTLNQDFQYTQDIVVHPLTGDVYAGTRRGVHRSSDGGQTWEKVFGSGLGVVGEKVNDLLYAELTNGLYVSTDNAVYKSATGNPGDWTSLTGPASNFMANVGRVEIAISHSDPVNIYAVGARGGAGTEVYHLIDLPGNVWVKRSLATNCNGQEFGGQAWYDLDIAVDPRNPARLYLAGISLYRSSNSGVTWTQISSYYCGPVAPLVHADQHEIHFDQENPNVMYFGNDGGIYRSTDGGNTFKTINTGYNVTQFYAGAIHPEEASSYFLGGTQDNGSLQLRGEGVVGAVEIWGGDGFFCFIDEDDPNIQLASSQGGNYGISTDGGQSFQGGAGVGGRFANPSDYDSEANILYAQTGQGDYYRWHIVTGEQTVVDIADEDVNVYAITVDRNVSNRVYFGTSSGRLYRVDNAHQGSTVSAEALMPVSGVISSIDVEDGDPDHLLVTVSNYGVNSVYESRNGGQNWVGHEGNLPNIPVRWGIFNPNDNNSAMIATELGVWVTAQLDGPDTEWLPPLPGRGIPLVRTDMLRLRRSDKMVLAATHGRGLFTTDVFSDPKARISAPQVAYEDTPILFYGGVSSNANSYFWEFGDGDTDTLENVYHAYDSYGVYPIRLTINEGLTAEQQVQVLPGRPLPYMAEGERYGGDFEGFTEQYGVETLSGSSFERGSSTINGKGGTHSGENAFVLGLNEQYYQNFTDTRLYLPNFDFSEQTIYEFSFWAKYQIHEGFDGFRVEYSTDRGTTWKVLGSREEPEWYNFTNTNADQAAWPVGTSYFTGTEYQWVQYRTNASFLAGKPDVAFRFVFKSDSFGNYIGLAIDDVQVTKYTGEPLTRVLKFEGEYSAPEEVTLSWTTEPEFNCLRFELEQSLNGRDFERIETIAATGRTTSRLQRYASSFLGQRNLYFFRMKVINENATTGYYHEFYTPIIVLRRNIEGTNVFRLFPNPFTDRIEMTFDDLVEEPVAYELFDVAGRLVQNGQLAGGSVFGTINLRSDLPFGAYILQIRIGDGEPETFKLMGGER